MNGDFTEITEEQRKEMYARGYKDFSGLALSIDYLEDLASLDLIGRATAFNKNVLILHGDSDTVVPISNSQHYLKAYGSRATFRVIHGADHTFSSIAWGEELLSNTVLFLKRELSW